MTTSPDLVTLTDPRSPAAEAFRALRTNLMFSSVDRPLRTLLVTSPAPDEGKSVALANLAVTLAQAGRKTILVDCDLRRPAQPEIWGLPNERGLTTMMANAGPTNEPPLQSVGIENLSLLLSGPNAPSPADLLGSRKMDEVIEAVKSRAEIVLFDAPPVLAVTDAALLGLKLDGVLLVMTAGHTRRDHAEQAKGLLEKVHIHIVGVLLNDAPAGSGAGKYYG
jgi:non-specific protein-tyrosine kinase